MISEERVEFALQLLEKLERSDRNFSIEDARRRLRILEIINN